jgi:hypothetical protein
MRQAAKQSDNPVQDIVDTANRMGDKIDMVNSPSHYNQSGIECIAAIQAALGPNFKYYLQGNVMKYMWRFDYKGKPLEDLQKAQWYLNTLIEDVVASDES